MAKAKIDNESSPIKLVETDVANKSNRKDQASRKKKKFSESTGLILVTLSLLMFLAMLSLESSGLLGRYVLIMYSLSFGYYISYSIPVIVGSLGLMFFMKIPRWKMIKLLFILISFSFISSTAIGVGNSFLETKLFDAFDYGPFTGKIGYYLSSQLIQLLGPLGALIFLVSFSLILFMYAFDFHLSEMLQFFKKTALLIVYPFDSFFQLLALKLKKNRAKQRFSKELTERISQASQDEEYLHASSAELSVDSALDQAAKESGLFEQTLDSDSTLEETLFKMDENEESVEYSASKVPEVRKNPIGRKGEIQIEKPVFEEEIAIKPKVFSNLNYQTPGAELLNDPAVPINVSENNEKLRENALMLREKLVEFAVDAEVVQINPGPVITQYEVKLAKGIKVARISSLEKDLAMALKAVSIRIVAPIPGKDTVGIEIPNHQPSIVYLKSIIGSEKFLNTKSKLAIALGKTISGENYILDLKKTPHLLIAGATGSGKSVCINGLIVSILYRATPEEVQFCMIDPKKVELSVYANLVKHHLLKIDGIDEAVVTRPEDAVRLLESLVIEMENRYETLKQSGTRNLDEYNDLIDAKELRYNETTGEVFSKMPYIVCIVDEYGDLMMTSGKAVEDPICRLAQMARAVGIHMVLATQRPSVKVVTGLIKANFPTRIAFRVMSQVDSRTILDIKGAESLLGKGDMLIIPPGGSELIRIQNALVETKEINRVVEHIAKQPDNFEKIQISARPSKDGGNDDGYEDYDNGRAKDPLFDEAKRMVIQHQMASVSMLQRALSVGYARAGKLIDQLEKDGVVGPHLGSKPRDVIMKSYD